MGFPKQEYWSGLPFPSPEDIPNPGIEPVSSALAGRFFTTEPPAKPISNCLVNNKRMSCYHMRNLGFSDCFIFMIFKAICNNFFILNLGKQKSHSKTVTHLGLMLKLLEAYFRAFTNPQFPKLHHPATLDKRRFWQYLFTKLSFWLCLLRIKNSPRWWLSSTWELVSLAPTCHPPSLPISGSMEGTAGCSCSHFLLHSAAFYLLSGMFPLLLSASQVLGGWRQDP